MAGKKQRKQAEQEASKAGSRAGGDKQSAGQQKDGEERLRWRHRPGLLSLTRRSWQHLGVGLIHTLLLLLVSPLVSRFLDGTAGFIGISLAEQSPFVTRGGGADQALPVGAFDPVLAREILTYMLLVMIPMPLMVAFHLRRADAQLDGLPHPILRKEHLVGSGVVLGRLIVALPFALFPGMALALGVLLVTLTLGDLVLGLANLRLAPYAVAEAIGLQGVAAAWLAATMVLGAQAVCRRLFNVRLGQTVSLWRQGGLALWLGTLAALVSLVLYLLRVVLSHTGLVEGLEWQLDRLLITVLIGLWTGIFAGGLMDLIRAGVALEPGRLIPFTSAVRQRREEADAARR